ncbi:hypothetical protein [Streptomyces sp. Ru87]|uniref:hypothetical protein n=1 Tax=Streptomyces sp. Ru87 TaxID=2044307 RepID=UPI000BF416E6|nr:hypothetical protein [Streptomyces sp. Ru87]PGH47718.1 hypothetical protein CRI70_27000 [Streptomyces sp. Ru87]
MNGDETVPGAALLLAAAPAGKGRLVDAAAALPALAAVRPGILAGTAAASVVELVEPADPQVVLTRLRVAAAVPGPLLVHLIGQLTLDRKQQLPHVALARTTPATARYTALPWHWLSAELQHRRPGTTTVLADLVADPAAWARLPALGVAGADLYGVVAPPPGRRDDLAEPLYSRAVADLLRPAARRPPVADLHALAVSRAQLSPEVRFLTLPGTPAGGTTPAPAQVPAQPGAQAPAPAQSAAQAPAQAQPAARSPEQAPARSAREPAAQPPGRAADTGASASTPEPRQATPPIPAPPARPHDTAGSVPERTAGTAAAPVPRQATPPRPAYPPAETQQQPPDPHPAILAAAHAGRHGEAAAMAAAWEQYALRNHGPSSVEAGHWLEVRADLARLAGDFARSCELWMAAASARLGRGEPADAADVVAAVDRAHHCWEQLGEPGVSGGLAQQLLPLRRRVPGPRPGAVEALERRIGSRSAARAG